MAEYSLSQNQLAAALGTPSDRLTEIVQDRQPITADVALRLSLYFGNSPEFWLNLQMHYDLKLARRNLPLEDAERISRLELVDSSGQGRGARWMLKGTPLPQTARHATGTPAP